MQFPFPASEVTRPQGLSPVHDGQSEWRRPSPSSEGRQDVLPPLSSPGGAANALHVGPHAITPSRRSLRALNSTTGPVRCTALTAQGGPLPTAPSRTRVSLFSCEDNHAAPPRPARLLPPALELRLPAPPAPALPP